VAPSFIWTRCISDRHVVGNGCIYCNRNLRIAGRWQRAIYWRI